MKKVFKRPGILKDVPFHYCPGCTHGVAHRLVAEVIEELGIRDTAIGVAPVGCSVFAMDYFEIDMFQASHGRAPAVATGIKRVLPDRVVLPTRGTGTWLPSVPGNLFMRLPGAKELLLSLSIMPFTA